MFRYDITIIIIFSKLLEKAYNPYKCDIYLLFLFEIKYSISMIVFLNRNHVMPIP